MAFLQAFLLVSHAIPMAAFKEFDRQITKRSSLQEELDFLIQCRNRKLTPRFISQLINKQTMGFQMNKCLKRCKSALLRAAIKDTRNKLDKCYLELYSLQSKLSADCHSLIWDKLQGISHSRAQHVGLEKRKTLQKKLDNLRKIRSGPQHATPQVQDLQLNDANNLPNHLNNFGVVNKTNISIPKHTLESLALGLNFVPMTHKDRNLENFVGNLEHGISSLVPQDKQDGTRDLICETLKSWMHRTQQKTRDTVSSLLKWLQDNNIFALPADKGNNTVIVSHNHYLAGVNAILEEKTKYSELKKNPLNKIISSVNGVIQSCISLDKKDKDRITSAQPTIPRLYALPKIHKRDMPFRPIISSINSMTHPVAKFVLSKIAPLRQFCYHIILNSSELLEKINKVPLHEGDILVSMDITALYPNIPVKEALETLEENMGTHMATSLTPQERSDILNLTETCLTNNAFTFNNRFFQQLEGLAMGSPLSTILADLFLNKLEIQKILNHKTLSPRFWGRYIDDVIMIWQHGMDNLRIFCNLLNSVHPTIKFTMELECDGKLPFLDVLLERKGTYLDSSVYRKPHAIDMPPHALSCHPPAVKTGTFKGYIYRAFRLCSTRSALESEIKHLRKLACSRGYDPSMIHSLVRKVRNKLKIRETTALSSQQISYRKLISVPFVPSVSQKIRKTLKPFNIHCCFKPNKNIASRCNSFKPKIPNEDQAGIYKIPCGECNLVYIGQTKNSFKHRLYQHQYACAIRKTKHDPRKRVLDIQKSAIAKHIRDSKHEINWSEAAIITACKPNLLYHLELVEIYKNRGNLMNRSEDNALPISWRGLF